MSVRVLRPGMLTTVQDLGRPGLGALGVPPSGAMDGFALRLANRLVGNEDGAAGLELTLLGPEILFEADCAIALAGAHFDAQLAGRPLPHAEAVQVRGGETLALGRALDGLRGYLAFSGGITVEAVLGSRSTFLPAGFGGFAGRALRAGDMLSLARGKEPDALRRLRPGALAGPASPAVVRVVIGPQSEAFSAAGHATFLASSYSVSSRSDRMGVRLEGAPIERVAAADLPPEGLAPGAIQVPGDGQPIILGADRPTTGGYTKIATVISVDLSLVAQARPGDALRFAAVDVAEARRFWREREELLASALEPLDR